MNPNNKHTCDPVTLEQLHSNIEHRVAQVSKELRESVNFIGSCQPSVTIFGSAVTEESDPDYEKARRVSGRIVKELNYAVVSGGAKGIMEAANRGAKEAGGTSIGLTIQLPHEQMTNGYLTQHLDFYYFFTRKVALAYSAEAYLFFPGGFGTHDELLEILTLVQTRKMEKDVPIVLVGEEFWAPFVEYSNHLLKRGKIDSGDEKLFIVTDDEDLIIETIRKAPIRHVAS